MQRIYIGVILCVTLFASGCALKVPFLGEKKEEKKVEVKAIERIPKYCYVRKGENPCEVCENVVCQGGRKK